MESLDLSAWTRFKMLTERVIQMAECIMHLMEATIPTLKFVYERGYCLWGSLLSFFQ